MYDNSHIDVCFEIPIRDYEDGTGHETRIAVNIDKHTCREENTHTRHELIEKGNRGGMCVRETESIIGKAPRFGSFSI